jgi:NAD(P)-dependent dehydrogenase (short-subunit alcohol dehydrogenase family)
MESAMDLGLKGKKVIMNGGARGIGLEILKILTTEGADVAFFSRDQGKIDAALAELAGNEGKAHGDAFDMTGNLEGYVAWLNGAVDKLGGCDIFINMASVSGAGATQDWQKCLDVDIMAAVKGIETLTPALEASGAGSIIVMSSTAAVETFIMPQAYNAIKAALITYASQLSQALAPKGIRVNTVSPGYIRTAINDAWFDTEPGKKQIAKFPKRRLMGEEGLDAMILFLCSDAAEFVTGTDFVLDDGQTL